jgi:2-methylcitrate dehydratase PrpD
VELDRRSLILAAGALPAVAAAQTAPVPDGAPAASRLPGGELVSAQLVRFAAALRFEDIPSDVVHAAKRLLVDSIGCTLTGWLASKGQRAAGLMTDMGGAPTSLVIGSRNRISATNAAFANAELMNALDFDAIPHLPPVTIPPLLAAAEAGGKSGKELVRGIVIAYEIGARLSAASSQMQAALLETNTTPEVFGINTEAIIGSAMGVAAMNGLSSEAISYAMGLGAYFCPPQSSHDWETGSPKSNVKYTPVGWISQGAVTAALLAGTGFTSNPIVLDGTAGFPRFYGWPKWRAERAVEGLGVEWRILNPDFKPYAACRYIHSRLDAVIALIRKHGIKPEQIGRIYSLGPPFVANPDQRDIRTQEDAQFSVPYMLAVAASGIPIDARCQDSRLLHDPAIHRLMARIEWDTHPRTTETKRADSRSFIASAEIIAGGKRYFEEVWAASGSGKIPELRLSDDALQAKFLGNAATRLPAKQAARLADALWSVEGIANVRTLMRLLEA